MKSHIFLGNVSTCCIVLMIFVDLVHFCQQQTELRELVRVHEEKGPLMHEESMIIQG